MGRRGGQGDSTFLDALQSQQLQWQPALMLAWAGHVPSLRTVGPWHPTLFLAPPALLALLSSSDVFLNSLRTWEEPTRSVPAGTPAHLCSVLRAQFLAPTPERPTLCVMPLQARKLLSGGPFVLSVTHLSHRPALMTEALLGGLLSPVLSLQRPLPAMV